MSFVLIDEHMAHPVSGAVVFERTRDIPPIETWGAQVSAWIPVYVNGNASLVLFRNGALWYIPWSAQGLYRRLAKLFHVDIPALRRAFEAELDKLINLPLVAHSISAVFVPLKFRKPIDRNDGAAGYFRYEDVTKVTSNKFTHETILHTPSGHQFHIRMDRRLALRQLRDSRSFAILLKFRGTTVY